CPWTQVFDNLAGFNSTSGIWTVPADGYYQLIAHADWDYTPTDGYRTLRIVRDGIVFAHDERMAGDRVHLECQTIQYLEVGDNISLLAYVTNAGAAATVTALVWAPTRFIVMKV